MDFNDSREEATFRNEAREWLVANAPTAADLTGLDDMGQAKLWQKRKADAGWACIRWPKEYGGRGANAMEQVILSQEEAKVKAPNTGFFSIGQGMAGALVGECCVQGDDEIVVAVLPALDLAGGGAGGRAGAGSPHRWVRYVTTSTAYVFRLA